MRAIVRLYFNKIISGDITIDDVPNRLRPEVQAELDNYYNQNN